MKRLVLGIAPILLVLAGMRTASGQSDEPASRTFQFRYQTVVKDVPAGAGKVEVWLPYPTSSAYQTIDRVAIEAPGPITISREPEYGNSILYVRVDHPTAREIPITMTFSATRREHVNRPSEAAVRHPRPLTAAQRALYLKPDRLVPTNGKIHALALQVTRGKTTDQEKARAIYDYVTHSMKYDKSGQGWGRGDALYACDALHGNCTDFHSLIIGMARSVGIPARFSIGFPLPPQRGAGPIPGYHCWAELYLQNIGWVPLDSSEASQNPAKFNYYYGAHDANRVRLSRGRDITLSPRQAGAPLNYFVYPYVEVDGKPYTAVDKQFAFADQPAGQVASAPPSGRR
jgi:transglutaminase-like putative cysteine protease